MRATTAPIVGNAINFPAANKVEGGLRRALIILSIRHAQPPRFNKQRVLDHSPLATLSQQIVEGPNSRASRASAVDGVKFGLTSFAREAALGRSRRTSSSRFDPISAVIIVVPVILPPTD